MVLRIKCSCGNVFQAAEQATGEYCCPECGRSCPASVQASRPIHIWIPITASAVGILLILVALLLALVAGDGGSTNSDPYAGRMARGVGSDQAPQTSGTTKPTTTKPAPAKSIITKPVTTKQPEKEDSPQFTIEELGSFAEITLDGKQPSDKPDKPKARDITNVTAEFGKGDSSGRSKRRGLKGNNSYARKMGATGESEDAVELALRWLAKVQKEDGHWSPSGDGKDRDHPVGITGLATLAFLGGGYTHKAGPPYGQTVDKALKWLLSRQRTLKGKNSGNSGIFSANFYEQGIATIVLCEAYGMTRDYHLRKPSQAALNHIIKRMGSNGGYNYSGPGDDVHVTSFQVMAVKSGKLAKLIVPRDVFPKLKSFYDRALQPDGRTGYYSSGGPSTPARTALGLFCRIFLDVGKRNFKVRKVAKLIDKCGPNLSDIFQTYYGTYGMFQMGGKYWKDWNGKFRDPLIAMQVKEGELAGSWNMGHRRRVISTSMCVMSLEVYYRYMPINK